jgi:hypothetical protein
MSKIINFLLIAGVLVLVVLGLNISSQGTSSFTGEDRKPIVGLQIEKQQIHVLALGQDYSLSRGDISRVSYGVQQEARQQYCICTDYLKKIWTIFHVLFLK